MINNEGTGAKHGTIISPNGTTGVKGTSEYEIFAETRLRVETTGFGGTNILSIEARIRNSDNWNALSTLGSNTAKTIDISVYDYLRYNITTADGLGQIVSSGFITNLPVSAL